MTLRYSDSLFLTVLDPLPLKDVGWEVVVKSERDYSTVIARIPRWVELGFTKQLSDAGGGSITLDADDPIWDTPLPAGETADLIDQEALWEFYKDGNYKFAIFAEDVDEDEAVESTGPLQTVITGRGLGRVLEFWKILPTGMPNPTDMQRKFTSYHEMHAWLQMFEEAQSNGVLNFVTCTFTATHDSLGNPWTDPVGDFTFDAGKDLLSLLKEACEANGWQWRMDRHFRLSVWPDLGAHLESSIKIPMYRDQKSHKHQRTRRDVATDVYVANGAKKVAVEYDAAARAKWHKRLTWITTGTAASAETLRSIALQTLSLSKQEAPSRIVKVVSQLPGRIVFVDYDVGDYIAIEQKAGDPTSKGRRVVAATVKIDKDLVEDLDLTLETRFEAYKERIQRRIDRIGTKEASDGAGSSSISSSSAASGTTLDDLSGVAVSGAADGDVLKFDGTKWVDAVPVLGLLQDVDLVPGPNDGDSLVYEASSSTWKPRAVSGASRRAVITRLTSGNVVVSSTSFVAFNTAMDLVIAAIAGDQLEFGFEWTGTGNATSFLLWDVASVNGSGTILNRWGGGYTDGVVAFADGVSSLSQVFARGVDYWDVVSGDRVSGNVKLRLYARVAAASPRTVYSGPQASTFWVKNNGQ